ncbi:MAG: SLC13 family permease [Fervidicoccaceae archaeon]
MPSTRTKVIGLVAVILLVFLLALVSGLNLKQVVSLTALAMFIGGSFTFWSFRVAFAFAGVSLLLFTDVIDIPHVIQFSNIDVIIFLISMMIIVGFLEERKFFDWITAKMIYSLINRPSFVFASILLSSFILASLVDEVTSILITLALTIRVCKYYNIDPLPISIFEVFTTNIGSSATVVGNPIGVLIAFRAGLTFFDFIRWSFPIALVSVAVVVLIGEFYFREEKELAKKKKHDEEELRGLEELAKYKKELNTPTALFLAVLIGLILHHHLEAYFNLPKNSLLLAVAMLGAGVALFIEHEKAVDLVERRVDWWTLVYFLLLFASVGTIQYTGISNIIVEKVEQVTQGNIIYLMLLISAIVGGITSVMDNVLAVSIAIPIVNSMVGTLNTFPIWWISLISGTYWGNATIIGSTANIVMAGYLEKMKKRGEHIGELSMIKWIKLGIPISAITFFIAFFLLYMQMGLMPHK